MTSPFQHAHAELIHAVIRQIDAYQGEVIVKGEHPLWLAVVELEKVSVRSKYSTKQPHRLDRPAARQWFHCIWASREPDPAKAMRIAGVLRKTLVRFLERGESGYDNPTIDDIIA